MQFQPINRLQENIIRHFCTEKTTTGIHIDLSSVYNNAIQHDETTLALHSVTY